MVNGGHMMTLTMMINSGNLFLDLRLKLRNVYVIFMGVDNFFVVGGLVLPCPIL